MTTLKLDGKPFSYPTRSAQNAGHRTSVAYARARMSNAAIHDRAPRAATRTRIGIVSQPFYRDSSRRTSIRARMESLLAEHGGRGAEAVTLLAASTDHLFARVARGQGMRLSVVIPCKNFQNFFATPDDLAEYIELRTVAYSHTALDYATFDREAFEKASKFIVDTCDLLVVVGSGHKPTLPGSTGSIVQYASEKGKQLVWIDPEAPLMAPHRSLIR